LLYQMMYSTLSPPFPCFVAVGCDCKSSRKLFKNKFIPQKNKYFFSRLT